MWSKNLSAKRGFRLKSTGIAPLSSSRVPRRLQDIIDNAQAIFGYTEGMELTAFEEDRKAYDAVERCLERISEAVAKLGDMAGHVMPDQPLQKIRAFGNILRHEYDAIRAGIVGVVSDQRTAAGALAFMALMVDVVSSSQAVIRKLFFGHGSLNKSRDRLFEIVKKDLPGLHASAVEALRRSTWWANTSATGRCS
jgi:uncharacterized protein with HEPN domain